MTNDNDLIITKLTVRLQDNVSLNYIGTGIIYDESTLHDKVYILTASHCLFEDADSFTNPKKKILLNIYNSSTDSYATIEHVVNPQLLFTEVQKDVAVLIIDKKNIDEIVNEIPIIESVKERSTYAKFLVKGFPKATQGEELAVLYPTWLQTIEMDNRFQIQLNEDYSDYNTQGFSGSGIFLIAENRIYLYGIFTRFRKEEKGKVIYCQYIETVNKMLSNNYCTEITFSYFENYGLNPVFFVKHIENSIVELGPRFNEKLNFQLPIAKLFNDIAKDNLFWHRFLNLIDSWVLERNYGAQKSNIHLCEIENDFEKSKQDVSIWARSLNTSLEEKIEVEWISNQYQVLNKKIDLKLNELYELRRDEERKNLLSTKESKSKKNIKDYNYRPPYDSEIYRLREIDRSNSNFIDAILKDININLANSPLMILDGEAGNGKSHLLGDIATSRIKRNLPTILLLAQTFTNSLNVWANVTSNLHLTCTKMEFLGALNNIGKQIGSRVLILIDAINEGPGKELWNNQIASFINEFKSYPYIGLVLTIRTTYIDFIIPNNVRDNSEITFITHEGFKGNEYAALKLFCEFHGIEQPNFPILTPEFTKPLFLQLICESVKATPEKKFPKGFQGVNKILKLYIEALNKKFISKPEYAYRNNLISEVVNKIALRCFQSNLKSIPLEEAILFFDHEYAKFPNLLNDLIKENILIKNVFETYTTSGNVDVIYFAYQRLGDFFIAEQLLLKYSNSDDLIRAFSKDNELGKFVNDYYWQYRGILEALSVLLPEKYNLELFEVYAWVYQEEGYLMRDAGNWINNFVIDSLKWREISSINTEKITSWLTSGTFYIETNQWFCKLTELTTIPDHPFNSDRLFTILSRYKMPKRDSFWQMYLLIYSGYDDNFALPIRRLIDWAWTPEISDKLDFETARLAGQTLSWVLATTNRKLRDETTKALVNLLENQSHALIAILQKFSKIDDLYILERLYAIAYGCILRTENKNNIQKIAQFVYNTIFKNGNPPTHILLRDYARNCIEFALYRNIEMRVDILLIRPPYKSRMPRLPNVEDMEKYESDYKKKSRSTKKYVLSQIHHSVIHWDFGRYIIDHTFDDFCQYSFGFENEYKKYFSSLDKNLKRILKTIRAAIDLDIVLQNSERKFYTLFGEEEYNSMVTQNVDYVEKLKSSITSKFPANQHYIISEVLPHFKNSSKYKSAHEDLDVEPIKYWIAQRAYQYYNLKFHESYEQYISNSSYGREGNIERIGKKYQWIAFFEILSMVTDNYMLKEDRWNSQAKYKYYKGPWQMYIRDINPSLITKKEVIDEQPFDLGIYKEKKGWWEHAEYKYWNQINSKWIEIKNDLPEVGKLIIKKDDNNNEWFSLKTNVSWEEPKPIGEDKYNIQRKRLWYHIQGYLVNKKDKTNIAQWLKKQNFWGRWMPESREHGNLINREKYWSPAYKDCQDKKWETIEGTHFKVILPTTSAVGEMSRDKSEANFGYDMPCKTIFEGMNLQYASVDGDFKNINGEIVVTNKDSCGILIKRKEFINFLNASSYDIIWTILGEKCAYASNSERNYFKELSGVFYLEGNDIVGDINFYDRE